MPREANDPTGSGGASEGGAALVFRALESGEGAKLVSCLRRCYGETHVEPDLYDAASIDRAIAAGMRRSAVAVTPDGEVVAHLGIALRCPGDVTADVGLTLVEPSHRGRGLARRLSIDIARMAIEMGLVGLHDYPVTVHGATQRLAAEHAHTMGLLLDNMPADVEFNAMEADGGSGATASLVRYMPIGAQPERDVHLPDRYAELAASLYATAGLPRRIMTGAGTPDDEGACAETDFATERYERRGVVRLVVTASGPRTAALERRCRSDGGGSRATQIDVPLRDPGAPRLISRLRDIGFFFGALLPEFRDGDVLRLQRLPHAPRASTAPVLEAGAMRAIARFVLSDASQVSGSRA